VRCTWAAAVCWLFACSTACAQEFETDARSAGRGGLWVLGRLEDSPGRQADRDWEFCVDASLPWTGLGMTGGAFRLQRNTNRWRAAACVSQLRTPVGSATALCCAAGGAWHAWSAGAALQLRELALDGTPPLWTPVGRLGMGGALGARHFACAVLQLAPPGEEASGGAAGFEAELVAGVRCGVQVVQFTGLGSEVRMGVECGAGAVRYLAGFDPNTHAISLGLVWQDAKQGITWGARTHPALGWSHWWTYTRGSAVPGS
jgi:hypothetical protein